MSLFSDLIAFVAICLALVSLVYAFQDTLLPTTASAVHWREGNTFQPIVFDPEP